MGDAALRVGRWEAHSGQWRALLEPSSFPCLEFLFNSFRLFKQAIPSTRAFSASAIKMGVTVEVSLPPSCCH